MKPCAAMPTRSGTSSPEKIRPRLDRRALTMVALAIMKRPSRTATDMSIAVTLHHKTSYRYDRAGEAGAARRPAAAGAALPHADPGLLAARSRPEQHFLNWQQDPYGNYLARLVFPEPGRGARGRGRPGRRDDGDQPVRLLRRAERREVPVRATSRRWRSELAPYLAPRRARARSAARDVLREHRRARAGATIDFLVDDQPAASSDAIALHHPHGAGRVRRPRRRSSCGSGSCRDFGLAARAGAAASRLRRALRLGLFDPARAPTSSRSTARRAPSRTSPTCTPGPRSTCPGAGWIGLDADHRACCAARGTSRSPARPTRPAPRRSSATRRSATSTAESRRSASTMSRHAHHETRASPSRTPRSSGHAIDALGAPGRRAPRRQRRAADDGRRADVRVDRRPRRRRVEHRRARARASARSPTSCCGGCATRFAPGGLLHYGQGKWYPGEPLPRWAFACYCRTRRRADLARPALFADEPASRAATAPADARGVHRARSPSALGRRRASTSCRPTRTSGTTCGASGGCRSTSTRSTSELDDAHRARAAGARLRAGLDAGRRLRAAARAAARTDQGGALEQRPWFAARRAHVPAPGRLADGLSPAARLAAVGSAEVGIRSTSAIRRHPPPPPTCTRAAAPRAAAWSVEPRDAPAALGDPAPGAGAHGAARRPQRRRRVRRSAAARPSRAGPASCAPRCASSRATACCTSSCRRSAALEDYLELVAAVEDTARDAATCRCCSRATRRRAIPRCEQLQGHAGSRASSRSTSSRRRTGTSWSTDRRRCTRRRG